MSKNLVIILSETRASELTFNNFKKNVIDVLDADLCLCIGVKKDYDYDNPFYTLAKYKFLYDEPDDFGDAFEYAYNILIEEMLEKEMKARKMESSNAKDGAKYEKMVNINALYGQIQNPRQSTKNITYYGKYDNIIDTNNSDINNSDTNNSDTNDLNINNLSDDEIIIHTKDFDDEKWKNQVYGIKSSSNNNFIKQDNVITYRKIANQNTSLTPTKHIYWREFLQIKDQFMGGVKDKYNQHTGSAGILIFFRWFLLKNLIDNNLLNKYDRFIITRSDFIYQLPHPKIEYMNENCIWIPDCEHYYGYTDRHAVLSKNNIESYLNIFNNFVFRSNEFYNKMQSQYHIIRRQYGIGWNLEQLIKFNLEQNNVLHLVKEFPYVMYSVRNINGTTRWSVGNFSKELGYYIKYQSEYDKSSNYKKEYERSGLEIDEFYKNFFFF